MNSAADTQYINTISINNDSSINIVSGGAYLRFNNSTNQGDRFRYYKSSSYTGQQPISLYKYTGQAATVTDSDKIQASLIAPYYNKGVYTKKTQIYVSEAGKNDIAQHFLGSVQVDRTTYYNGDSLLMGNYDGTFKDVNSQTGINSGYGTDANGNLTQFKLLNIENKEISNPTYSANNTHPNWHDKDENGNNVGKGMEGFYMTLNDMTEGNYFDGWSFENNKATYGDGVNVIKGSNKFVQDFLAFTAPCLQPMVLDASSSNYFQITKLEISEGNHVNFGKYLSLKMYVSSTNDTKVNNKELILSEARIYTGNQIIDEDVNAKLRINSVSGGKVESSHENGIYYKPDGQTITFTVTPYEDYELTGLTVTNNNELLEIEFDPTGCEFNVQMNGDVVVTPEFTKVETGDDSGDTLAPLTEAKSLSFANKAQRTEFSTTRQVWTQNNVTLINDKAASSNNVADYANPVRLYAGSSITIECSVGTFNKIVFTCKGSSYVTPLKDSIGTVDGVTVTTSGSNVTVVFAKAVSVFEIEKLTKQVQLNSLTVSHD